MRIGFVESIGLGEGGVGSVDGTGSGEASPAPLTLQRSRLGASARASLHPLGRPRLSADFSAPGGQTPPRAAPRPTSRCQRPAAALRDSPPRRRSPPRPSPPRPVARAGPARALAWPRLRLTAPALRLRASAPGLLACALDRHGWKPGARGARSDQLGSPAALLRALPSPEDVRSVLRDGLRELRVLAHGGRQREDLRRHHDGVSGATDARSARICPHRGAHSGGGDGGGGKRGREGGGGGAGRGGERRRPPGRSPARPSCPSAVRPFEGSAAQVPIRLVSRSSLRFSRRGSSR